MENFIIGRKPVIEALKANQPIEKILILYGTHGNQIERIKKLALKLSIPIKEVDKKRFVENYKEENTQGVIAIIKSFRYCEVQEILECAKNKNEPPFIVILDEIEDPHNMGALIRSAECAGAHGVIIPLHHSASINSTVIKSSAGATAYIPIARVKNVAQTIDELKKEGLWIVGTDASSKKRYYEQDYSSPLAIVIGNEGRGIRRLVKEKCDFLISIPMHGKIESLNASVAGALVMFEVTRTRNYLKK